MEKEEPPIKNWNAKEQADFWKIYSRKRAQQLDFAKEKAGELFFSDQRETAIELLSYFINNFKTNKSELLKKAKYPSLYKTEVINFCIRKGVYHEKMNEPSKAEQAYYEGESIYLEEEKDSVLISKKVYDGYFSLATLYLGNSEVSKAKEILNKIESSKKKIHLYGLYMKLHREVALSTNDFEASDRIHKNKIKPSYEELENLHYINIANEISNNLNEASEAIVVYHHAICKEIYKKNKESLEQLEYFLKNKIKTNDGSFDLASYENNFLNKKFIPELGAYIGEVLINEFNGKWKNAGKLMKSRILISGIEFNPFEYAYKVVYFGHRLIEEVFEKVKEGSY